MEADENENWGQREHAENHDDKHDDNEEDDDEDDEPVHPENERRSQGLRPRRLSYCYIGENYKSNKYTLVPKLGWAISLLCGLLKIMISIVMWYENCQECKTLH